MKRFDILIALIIAFSWGSNFIAVKYSISEVPIFLTISLRFLIISIILLPFVTKPKVNFKDLYTASITFGVFYIGLFYYALYLGINTSLAVILMQLVAPFSILIARVALKEYFTLNSIVGIIIAFCGTLFVVGSPGAINNSLAIAALVLGTIFHAIFNVQSRKLKAVPAVSLLFWNSVISVPHLFMISYFLEGNPFELIENTTYIFWNSLFYTAIVAGAIGITSWIYLVQKYPVYQVMPFVLLIPPIGIFLSVMILDEPISWHLFVGCCLTIIGVYVSQKKITLI